MARPGPAKCSAWLSAPVFVWRVLRGRVARGGRAGRAGGRAGPALWHGAGHENRRPAAGPRWPAPPPPHNPTRRAAAPALLRSAVLEGTAARQPTYCVMQGGSGNSGESCARAVVHRRRSAAGGLGRDSAGRAGPSDDCGAVLAERRRAAEPREGIVAMVFESRRQRHGATACGGDPPRRGHLSKVSWRWCQGHGDGATAPRHVAVTHHGGESPRRRGP
jgi:hypothetical protein